MKKSINYKWGTIWLILYIGTIPAANFIVQHFGASKVFGIGPQAPYAVYLAGLAFTFRDLAQNKLGRAWIIIGILLGGSLSLLIAPTFAIASATAFLVSELADFSVYTPLMEAGHWIDGVLLSNTVGLLVDSMLFLWLAFHSLAFLPGQLIGKTVMTLLAIMILWPTRKAEAVRV